MGLLICDGFSSCDFLFSYNPIWTQTSGRSHTAAAVPKNILITDINILTDCFKNLEKSG